jgi:hypothetical protein
MKLSHARSVGNVALAMPINISVLPDGVFGIPGGNDARSVMQIADAAAGDQGLLLAE